MSKLEIPGPNLLRWAVIVHTTGSSPGGTVEEWCETEAEANAYALKTLAMAEAESWGPTTAWVVYLKRQGTVRGE